MMSLPRPPVRGEDGLDLEVEFPVAVLLADELEDRGERAAPFGDTGEGFVEIRAGGDEGVVVAVGERGIEAEGGELFAAGEGFAKVVCVAHQHVEGTGVAALAGGEAAEVVVAEFDEGFPIDFPAFRGFDERDGKSVRVGLGDDEITEESRALFAIAMGGIGAQRSEGGGAVRGGGVVGLHFRGGFRGVEDVKGAGFPIGGGEEGSERGFGGGDSFDGGFFDGGRGRALVDGRGGFDRWRGDGRLGGLDRFRFGGRGSGRWCFDGIGFRRGPGGGFRGGLGFEKGRARATEAEQVAGHEAGQGGDGAGEDQHRAEKFQLAVRGCRDGSCRFRTQRRMGFLGRCGISAGR